MIELPNIQHGIPNFLEVDPGIGIYRGGQPTAEGWNYLGSIGIKHVIKLNGIESGKDYTREIGATLYYAPIPLWQQIFTEPDLQEIRDVAGFIRPGTFVHCEHGQDRTGLVIGYWRVMRCGWTKEKAYNEMIELGFHPELVGLLKAWRDL